MFEELSRHGAANVLRAYGDSASPTLEGWKGRLHDLAIRPIQQFSYSQGKNGTDIALVIDAMELLYTQKPEAFCIASSDADFTPLVMVLKANGHDVHGFGERKTPSPFVDACTTFVYLDVLTEPIRPSAVPVDLVHGEAAIGSVAAVIDADIAVLCDAQASPLAQDAALRTTLRQAVEACANGNGWAQMGAVGNAAKRGASINPRSYRMKDLPALFAASGLFEIVKGADGQEYIADRADGGRTPLPIR